ncbi:MAG: HAMP domain-containing histidine kinase [Lachnospiraceae bacterium]|nr:HAMP domain-containing histidine kinase [Lachnospiraceae bacterium]
MEKPQTKISYSYLKQKLKELRISLYFTISWIYLKLFILYGIAFFFLTVVVYFGTEKLETRDLVKLLEDKHYESVNELEYVMEANQFNNVSFYVLKSTTVLNSLWSNDEIVYKYDRIKENEQSLNYVFSRYYMKRTGGRFLFFIKSDLRVAIGTENYYTVIFFDMSNGLYRMNSFMKIMLCITIGLVILIMLRSIPKLKTLLSPLNEVTQKAAQLDLNNVSKGRVTEIEANNELRDFVDAYHKMIDRLWLAYENQKTFISNASHELRTPIAVFRGYIDMLKRWGAEDPEVLKESIDAIDKEAASMNELVNKLLVLSRYDRRTMQLKKNRFSMDEVIEELVKEFQMTVSNREIKAEKIDPIVVYGDPQTLKQAVRVFVDNAIKYTEDGGVIKISCINSHGTCVIEVADNGIGMKQEDVEHIFGRFYRSDDVRGRQIEGHGLGLSIAQIIIFSHGGSIEVKSQFTKGSSFKIILPKGKLRKE